MPSDSGSRVETQFYASGVSRIRFTEHERHAPPGRRPPTGCFSRFCFFFTRICPLCCRRQRYSARPRSWPELRW